MNNRFFSAVALATLFVPLNQVAMPGTTDTPVAASPAAAPTAARLAGLPLLSLQPESQLWLEGTSTVRSYKCAAKELLGEVRTTPAAPLPVLEGLAAVVREAGITIPVAQLDCDNGTMNGHMQKALKAKEHGIIAYRLEAFEVMEAGEAGGQVEMKGHLTIAGEELPITFPAEIELTADGAIRLKGQTELNMKEFGVEPPKLMLGTLKVNERVTVHFDVIFGS
jgi:hypothetical protein